MKFYQFVIDNAVEIVMPKDYYLVYIEASTAQVSEKEGHAFINPVDKRLYVFHNNVWVVAMKAIPYNALEWSTNITKAPADTLLLVETDYTFSFQTAVFSDGEWDIAGRGRGHCDIHRYAVIHNNVFPC